MSKDFLRKNSFVNNNPINKYDEDTKTMLKEIIVFLKNFAILLEMTKGLKQKLITPEELSIFSREYQCSTGYMLFNFKDFCQQYISELSTNINTHINNDILDPQLLSFCLLYIKNLIQDDDADAMEIFEYFSDLKKCILISGADVFPLNTRVFRELISRWIVDLVRIITDADDIPRNAAKNIKVLGVIKYILISLAKCNFYCDVLLREISQKIKYVLSYHAASKEFSTYMIRKSKVLLYILWILHICVNEFPSRGYSLNKGLLLGIRKNLKVLTSCLENNCPSVIKHLGQGILRVVK